jgi:transglutaminase-like putative cysteine protease
MTTELRRRRQQGAGTIAPLLLSVSIVVALARLIEHGFSTAVLVPIIVALVVGDGATALARRWMALPLAVVTGTIASLVALIISVDPAVCVPGARHFLSTSVLSSQYHAAQYALAHQGTPLPRLSGVIAGIGALGSLTAALTRGLWCRRREIIGTGKRFDSLSPCVAPTCALFIYTTLVSANRDRLAAAVVYFAGVVIFVGLADRRPSVRTALSSLRRSFKLDIGTMASFALALAVVVGAGIGLSGMRLTVFHVTPPKPLPANRPTAIKGIPGSLLTGLELLDNLRTVELNASNDVIFRATSPIATYWQVGTLSTFNGTEWLPTPGVDQALSGSTSVAASALEPDPPPSPSPKGFPNFTTRITISDLFSRLLPAPPHAVTVTGLPGAEIVGDEGILAATATQTGTTYGATSWLSTSASVEGPQLATTDPRLAPFVALPSQPAVVSQLAHEAVGNLTTVQLKVQALVNWFRNGQFRYTLTPPATTGPDPLVQFLTVTKAGYCQQFAGAFAVLARTLDIPTRLVVGFIAGRSGANDTFTVTGADAHVWPQVYLGPEAGWVSVEPTPSSAVGSAVPLGVLEPSNVPKGTSSNSTPTSLSTSGGSASPTTVPSGGSTQHRTNAPHSSSSTLLVLLIAAIAAVLLVLIGLMELRRRRSVVLVGLPNDEQVVRAWERALLALQRRGLAHRKSETPYEYVARISRVSAASDRHVNVEALSRLAEIVEYACYTPQPCTPAQASDAWRMSSMVAGRERVHRRQSRRATASS